MRSRPYMDLGQRPPSQAEDEVDADQSPGSEKECCAICFEVRPSVPLPCSCRITYCAACWDRALATSVLMCGFAQCPSCRCSFLVDYDTDTGGLLLRPDSKGTAAKDWRTQLYHKARPVQIRLLQSYGAAKTLEESKRPQCVCGAPLERMSDRDRMERMLEDTDKQWRSRIGGDIERSIDRLVKSSLVTCDLCDQDATRSRAVWTCTNGPYTVLHPAAYDVCERCFNEHSRQPALGEGTCGAQNEGSDSPRCCHPCAAAVRSLLTRGFKRSPPAPAGGPVRHRLLRDGEQ